MERYLKNPHINSLIKLAHELEEKYNMPELEELISLAQDVRGKTLGFDLPGDFLLKDLISLCIDNKIKFAVIGGMALSAHGMPRKTASIDILLDKLPDSDKTRDSDYMARFGFYRKTSSTGTVLTIDHRKDGQIEMLLANEPIRLFAIDTAVKLTILNIEVPVVSAAALIGLKAEASANDPRREGVDFPDISNIWFNSRPDLSQVKPILSEKALAIVEKLCI